MMIEEAREIMEGLLNDAETTNFLELDTDKIQITFFAFSEKLKEFTPVDEKGTTGHFGKVFKMLIMMANRAA